MATDPVPRIAVEIDGVAADIGPQIVSAFVMLRSDKMGDTVTIELNDSLGSPPLPRQDASMRIVMADVEVFRGSVARISGDGDDKGRTLRIFGVARTSPPAADMPPLACVWGQNLVGFNVTAKLEPAEPESRHLDAGVLTMTLHPTLRPGMQVAIAGVRAQIDGNYLVNAVAHNFRAASGFSTSVRIRRP